MKKLYSTSLLMLFLTGACVLGSCSDDETSQPDTSPQSENKVSFNEETRQLNSAVYSAKSSASEVAADEEAPASVYTFYLSPTKGLTDVEGMDIADNYIKIVSDQVKGDVDLSVAGNEISYADFSVNSTNAGEASKTKVSIELLSAKVVNIAVNVEMGGKKLNAVYYGLCSKQADPVDPTHADILLDRPINTYYLGQAKEGDSHNYYLIFSNAPFANSNNGVALTEPGYMFVADLYAKPAGEDVHLLPEGTYLPSLMFEDHTYDKNYSGITYFGKDGSRKLLELAGDEEVKVIKDGEGWIVSARVIDIDGKERTIAYKGELRIIDRPEGGAPSLPQINGDVTVDCISAKATYYGNMMNSATGMMWINLYDEKYLQGDKGTNGYAAAIVLFNDLFANPKDATLKPGVYGPNQSFKHGTWLPAVEIPMQGMTLPFGTYAQFDDGTNFGQFSYAKTGNVTITEGAHMGEFTIEFELESIYGYKIKGKYSGPIEIIDASEDKDTDDGTSTLEKDYEMNLKDINTTVYSTPKDIYIQGIGFKPVSTYENICGFQTIDIGLEVEAKNKDDFKYRKPGGDIFRMQLCTEPGKEGEITPGEYEVQPHLWPDYFKPNVMLPGLMLEGALTGSRWMHQSYKIFESGYVFEFMDAHALIYGGKVTISKVEGKENHYKFDIDGICVRKHHVTGTWEGPVVRIGGGKSSKANRFVSNAEARHMAASYQQNCHRKIEMGE